VRQFILELNRREGVTVILTTHDMDDIESLCSRVMVIGEGRILCDGTLESLRRRVSSERRLIVDLQHRNGRLVDPDAVVVREEGSRVELAFDPQKVAPAELIGRLAARYPVRDLFVQNPPIEEVVCRLYRNASVTGEPAGGDGGRVSAPRSKEPAQ
jgi:ABC-2 type transport system ATP-binding protein